MTEEDGYMGPYLKNCQMVPIDRYVDLDLDLTVERVHEKVNGRPRYAPKAGSSTV